MSEMMEENKESGGKPWFKAQYILLYFVTAAAIIWLLTGFYQVKSDQIAIVERLGQYISTPNGQARQFEQGLHYTLPWPIDTVHKVSVQQTATLRVNAFDTTPANYAEFRQQLQRDGALLSRISALFDPYLITADKSVVHMDISVVYRISDPEAWLNTISHSATNIGATEDPDDLRQEVFQQIAQHAMITRVSHMTLEQVLFSDLAQLSAMMQDTLEKAMELRDPTSPTGKLALGAQVMRVDVVKSRPPERVRGAYDQVQQAKTNFQRVTEEARAAKATRVRLAQGRTETMLTEARQYATERTERAKGEAARFSQVLKQYQESPEAARFDVFAEAARAILSDPRRIWQVRPGEKVNVYLDPPQYDPNQVRAGQEMGANPAIRR